jgi:hypothetical protein
MAAYAGDSGWSSAGERWGWVGGTEVVAVSGGKVGAVRLGAGEVSGRKKVRRSRR